MGNIEKPDKRFNAKLLDELVSYHLKKVVPKYRKYHPPVTETRSLWSSAAYFAARCCSSGKTVFSMEVFWGAMAYETDRYLYGGSDLSAVDFTDRPPGIQKLDRLAGAGY